MSSLSRTWFFICPVCALSFDEEAEHNAHVATCNLLDMVPSFADELFTVDHLEESKCIEEMPIDENGDGILDENIV